MSLVYYRSTTQQWCTADANREKSVFGLKKKKKKKKMKRKEKKTLNEN